MTDDMLGPSPMHIKFRPMYTTDFAYCNTEGNVNSLGTRSQVYVNPYAAGN